MGRSPLVLLVSDALITGWAVVVNWHCCTGSAAAPHQFTPGEGGVWFWLHPTLLLQDTLPSLHF